LTDTATTITTAVAAVVGLVTLIFIMPIIAAGLGAFAGWLVGSAFVGTAATVLSVTGLHSYQWGAILAFAGSFFKSTFTQTN
jgi:phosphotransferase system  glucose/maltose/N-acetylglucosamine-specific IIC component